MPVINAWPTTVGVYVTLHVPAAKVQLVELKEPVLLVVKLTLPVGVTAPAPDASVTVTAHVLGVLSSTLAGEQVTLVAEALMVEARLNVPLLVRCAEVGL